MIGFDEAEIGCMALSGKAQCLMVLVSSERGNQCSAAIHFRRRGHICC